MNGGDEAVHRRFPFGRPSTACPPRRPVGPCDLFVLGVYPSALHVRWTLPEPMGSRREIRALAVDVEPTVFWDGADQHERIAAWKDAVGFDEACDGSVGPVDHNGSTGAAVVRDVLGPLGIDASATWFTDCIPWFFVKRGGGQQGDAIAEVYDRVAPSIGREPAHLPIRPSAGALVSEAASSQRPRLLGELEESGASVVVTLGEEARATLALIADAASGPGATRLSVSSYGERGAIDVGGRAVAWYALKHPGQRSRAWQDVHRSWRPV